MTASTFITDFTFKSNLKELVSSVIGSHTAAKLKLTTTSGTSMTSAMTSSTLKPTQTAMSSKTRDPARARCQTAAPWVLNIR